MTTFRELLVQIGVSGYPISQGFGVNAGKYGYGAQGHTGADIAVPAGTPLKAPVGAVGVMADHEADYGNYLKWFFPDGSTQIWGHLSEFLGITPGQMIRYPKPGTVYGKSGSTGNSTGPHVHLEQRDRTGKPLNPMAGARWVPPTAAEIKDALTSGRPLAPYLTPDAVTGAAVQAANPGVQTITEAQAQADKDRVMLAGFDLRDMAVSLAGFAVAALLFIGGVMLLAPGLTSVERPEPEDDGAGHDLNAPKDWKGRSNGDYKKRYVKR